MKLLHQRVLGASSLLAPVPVVHLRMAVAPQETAGDEWRARAAAGHLAELLPPIPPRSAPGQPAVPVFPEDRTYAPEEMAACVALALQREFGFRVDVSRGLPRSADGTCEACFQYADAELALMSGRLAVTLVDAAWSRAEDPSGAGADTRLQRLLAEGMNALRANSLSVVTRRIVWEAERRDIPWSRIRSHPSQKTVELGHGHKLRRFRGSYTSDTSFIATMLATSKQGACDLFRSYGIPVPRQILVGNGDEAVAAARRIGYPVVVKPEYADMGQGVRINLNDEQSVRDAFAAARAFGNVLVAEQIRGKDYRATLIHGRMVAAGSNIAAHVVGDGRSTIEQLIAILNSDPRRGSKDYCTLTTIVVDDEIRRNLEDQHVTLATIPQQREVVWLRRWWRQSKDHTAEDATSAVHPTNRAMFERAARLIGLDVAGIDFVTPDISRPWTEVGGAILEINPTPGLNTHIRAGTPDILAMVVDASFPPGDDGRIPTAAVVGSGRAVRTVARILNLAGYKVGLATEEAVEIDNAVVFRGSLAGGARSRMVLSDPLTEAAVLQFSTGGAFDSGLGLDKAAVGAVMCVGQRRETPAEPGAPGKLEDCMALIARVARDVIVLNAEDPGCVRLAGQSRAKRVCWIASNPDLPMVADHIEGGGLAVTTVDRDGVSTICLWDRGEPWPLTPAAGTATRVVEALLAAAIAFGLGVSAPVIAAALTQQPQAGQAADRAHDSSGRA
ncbi:MAG: acetate--CoA ligase family protein [Alphaproteobacteria bacterium]